MNRRIRRARDPWRALFLAQHGLARCVRRERAILFGAGRGPLAVAAVRVALEARRRRLPPWVCPWCGHGSVVHDLRRGLSLTVDGGRVSGGMKVEWRCDEPRCRCRGTWSLGDVGPDEPVRQWLTRVFKLHGIAARRRGGNGAAIDVRAREA